MKTACCEPTSPNPSAASCACDCVPADPTAVAAERNRYFTGKYMTARDFRDEQGFIVARQRLHQRILHGSGIVCGLKVVPHTELDCRSKGWIVITPGIAIDCFGRDILVREPLIVNLPRVYPHNVACGDEHQATEPPAGPGSKEEKQQSEKPGEGPLPKAPPERDRPFLIGVRFGELCVEPVPVLIDESGCGERRTPNRIRETVAVRYRDRDPNDCWGAQPTPCPCCCLDPDPDRPFPESLREVLAPLCRCGTKDQPDLGFIPLALCTFAVDKNGAVIVKVDQTGRQYLDGPLNPCNLTHICRTNWAHGESMWLDRDGHLHRSNGQSSNWGHEADAREKLSLSIQFDGPLVSATDESEFYRRIFQVRYETLTGELLLLHGESEYSLSDDKRVLTYSIPIHCLSRMREQHPWRIHVALNGDFLSDECGRAVDANHLKGLLAWDERGEPKGASGDGVEGGTFESWFSLNWEAKGHDAA